MYLLSRILWIVALAAAISLAPAACSAYASPQEEREEAMVHEAFLDMLSCESLESLAQHTAELVLEDEKELAKPRCHFLRKVDPICRAYDQLRKEHMQALTDVEEVGRRNCGWDR